jgi:hypothetical protein
MKPTMSKLPDYWDLLLCSIANRGTAVFVTPFGVDFKAKLVSVIGLGVCRFWLSHGLGKGLLGACLGLVWGLFEACLGFSGRICIRAGQSGY